MAAALPGTTPHRTVTESWQRPEKYLTFALSRLPFAVQMARVQEIMGVQLILSVPDAPPYLKGAICVRRKLIPVIDLRIKLGLSARELSRRNCILLMRIRDGLDFTLVGAIVDSVLEVFDLAKDDIREAPASGHGLPVACVAGVSRIRGRQTRLLDVDSMLTPAELTRLKTALF